METQTPWLAMFLLPTAIIFIFIAIVKVIEKIWDKRKKDNDIAI